MELRNVTYVYPDQTAAVENLSLKIGNNEKIAVLGGNGAGKSTLFLLLNGVYKISNGEIFFKGEKIKYNKKNLFNLRRSTGIVFQDPETQIFSSSVYEEISFGLENLGIPKSQIKIKVDRVLQLLNISHIKDKPTHLLSYGEKKKVSIADILVMDPEILIMDEPDACLDPQAVKNLIALLNEVYMAGKTIIVSTQDVNLAYEWADRIIVMKGGKVLKDGQPLEVFSDLKIIEQASLELPLIYEMVQNLNLQNKFPVGKVIQKKDMIDILKSNH